MDKLMKVIAANERRRAAEQRKTIRTLRQRDRGLGYLVYCMRRFARLSQSEFARKVGRSHSTICRWENNMRLPSFDDLAIMADVAKLELVIGLRRKDDGDIIVLGVSPFEWPENDLYLLEDRFSKDHIPPLSWRKQLEEKGAQWATPLSELEPGND